MKKNINRLVIHFLVIAVLLSGLPLTVPTNAAGVGLLTYSISNGEVTITDCVNALTGELVIPDTIDGYPVRRIGNNAFDSSKLTRIILPDSVISIGSYALSNCTKLTSITMPENITSIQNYTFSGCSSLTSITIPDSVTSIGYCAFEGCTSLTSITIPDSVTSIGGSAFKGCSNLTSITIPDGVTAIGESAFKSCSSLTSITIPDGVTAIGSYAFYYCTNLTSITIPDSVTSIESGAFYGCSKLTSITIPESITSIENGAFLNCSSLTSITIPDSVISIGYRAFESCSSLTSITIPDSVTAIGESAFESCSSLTSITIPDGVTSIERYTFSNCKCLTSITFPDSITCIREFAFYDCSGLTEITIPKKLNTIEKYAFNGCDSLKTVYFKGNETAWNKIDIAEHAFFYSFRIFYLSQCTVIYDANGGSGAPSAQVVQENQTFYLSNQIPSLPGFVFMGWSTEQNGDVVYNPGDECTVTDDLTLYAVWKRFYTVTYDANGGSGAPSAQVEQENQTFYLSSQTPSLKGAVFKGWSTTPNGHAVYLPGGACTVTSDLTLYAVWQKHYTVTYNANGGSGAPSAQVEPENQTFSLSSQAPSLKGAIFMGWSTTPNGYAVYAPGAKCTLEDNLTLYAVWHQTCNTCSGSGYHGYKYQTCSVCKGSGYGKCNTCGGDGISGTKNCTICNGTGSRSISCTSCAGKGSITSSCSTCKGSGSVSKPVTTICGFCSGTGMYMSSTLHIYVICNFCNGIGQLTGNRTETCSRCSGSGKGITTLCSSCGGAGRKTTSCPKKQNVTCTACSGSGKSTKQDCRRCGADGKEMVEQICTSCNGNGTVLYEPLNGNPSSPPSNSDENNNKIKMGDVNCDGKINIGDVAKLYHYIRTSTKADVNICDINGDGRVNIGDVAKLYATIKAPS